MGIMRGIEDRDLIPHTEVTHSGRTITVGVSKRISIIVLPAVIGLIGVFKPVKGIDQTWVSALDFLSDDDTSCCV